MCGINGFITSRIPEEQLASLIGAMNTAIHHRGPDDQGVYISRIHDISLTLGQVRLSIIDLSPAGHQPMHYQKNIGASNEIFQREKLHDLSIVFNGEIYNYLEIRTELESKGYIFSTHSDTEVILASYDAWGRDCVLRFNGMWAFALYDEKQKLLFCSRDRFGKKPLYYYISDTDFIFSSELKGILEHKDLKINSQKNILPEAIDFYFTMGNIPSPLTIYKNISKLDAGSHLVVTWMDGKIQIQREKYYELPIFTPSEDKVALIKEGKLLLEDAVKIRMFSADVPVGAFLSGGLDSSSVVAEMTKWTEKSKLHTFSIGFEGKYDETSYINIVKDAFGTIHHHKYFREPDFHDLIEHVSFFYDEPFADYSNFPTMFVSELARKNVTVSLSGDGGDEVFGGYMMHKVAAQMDILYTFPRFIRKIIYALLPQSQSRTSLFYKLKEAFRISCFPKEDFYAELGKYTTHKPEIYKKWTQEKLRYLLEKNQGNFIQSIIDFDLLYNTLADNFLVKVDRASMAYALEVRAPFLDYRIIEYARKIPTKWKSTVSGSKILLKMIVEDIVPRNICDRKKKGFTPPIGDWILQDVYQLEIIECVQYLNEMKLISIEWLNVFNSLSKQSNDAYSLEYQTRILLFHYWYIKWIL